MPHWGFRRQQRARRGLADQLLHAIAKALEADFHPRDASRLLALGRALGLLGRITSEDVEFQARAQDSRDALADRVASVLAEATGEAGDHPLDPELLLTLTEALAAGFDQPR